MKKLFLVAALAALPAAGCFQTLPDGSIAATPQTSSLMTPGGALGSDGPPVVHQVRDGSGRMISADPDPHVRSAISRNMCEAFGGDQSACPSGQ